MPTQCTYTDTNFIFRKKSKVYWNFKLHLKNPNPNPDDIQQDKVSQSGKCSLSQNLLTQTYWVHLPAPQGIKATYFSCPPQDSILWVIPKFPTKIKNKKPKTKQKPTTNKKNTFSDKMWSPSGSSLNPILCSQHQWMVGLAFKRGLHVSSVDRWGRVAAARHLWPHYEAGPPLPPLYLES